MRAAIFAACVLAASAATPLAAARPTAVGVSQLEFRIAIHRETVPTGRVRLNVSNLGEDGHDLVVRRKRRVVARLRELRPGERATLRTRLRRPGRYRLVCTIADHEARGMRSVLTAVRR